MLLSTFDLAFSVLSYLCYFKDSVPTVFPGLGDNGPLAEHTRELMTCCHSLDSSSTRLERSGIAWTVAVADILQLSAPDDQLAPHES